MSSVIERLIESWLDSQTERRYQAAFIQLLVSQRWNVLHNTRHSPIELGKDVIARDPQGVLYCFQLKGNPGSRFTKTEAQTHLPQLIELLELPPARQFRSKISEKHVAAFVTNGEIDEEARIVFEAAAERAGTVGCPSFRFELWGRGTLVSMFLQTAGSVWPTSIEGTRNILNLMAQDGQDVPDYVSFTEALAATASPPTEKTSAQARTGGLPALLLVAEIAKSPWYASENHYGLYAATVITSVYALRFADNAKRFATVKQYAALCLEHAADLISEAQRRDFDPFRTWVEADPLAEIDIMWERRNLVGECAAILSIAEGISNRIDPDYGQSIVEASVLTPRVWGLAAVPSLMVRYWVASRQPGWSADLLFGRQLEIFLDANNEKIPNIAPLAPPYYGFVACWALNNQMPFIADEGDFTDSFRHRIWFARAMLFMLAKRNMKQTCKRVWPSFSSLTHEEPDLPKSAFFDCRLSPVGQLRSYTFHRGAWNNLLSEAVEIESEGAFLEPFSELSWLIAAYVAVVPYRAWTGVVMWLDRQINTTWY